MLKPELDPVLAQRVTRDEPLARHTTFRIGGPADLFVRADTLDEIVRFVGAARRAGLAYFILGNGSNILVSDRGVRGLTIEVHADAYTTAERQDGLLLSAESGASLPGLANRLARHGWSGLEWAIGVPSTIGAAIVGNAGAHGGCIADNLLRAQVLTSTGVVEWWDTSALEYAYRTSRLKRGDGREVVLKGEFLLQPDDPPACIARMGKYTEHRRRTQPTDPSVGSMFKNPPGDYSGRLIEAAGLKGRRVGNVEVSRVHANFFVNQGGATAREVIELAELVREQVKAAFSVELELEIQLVGEWT